VFSNEVSGFSVARLLLDKKFTCHHLFNGIEQKRKMMCSFFESKISLTAEVNYNRKDPAITQDSPPKESA